MVKMATKGCPALLERKGVQEGGVTKDPKVTKGREVMSGSEATRAIQDRTASREEPKEKPETSAPWVSLGETGCLEGLENLGRAVALAEGDQQELRATRAAPARRAPWESRGPEARRVRLVPPVLQA